MICCATYYLNVSIHSFEKFCSTYMQKLVFIMRKVGKRFHKTFLLKVQEELDALLFKLPKILIESKSSKDFLNLYFKTFFGKNYKAIDDSQTIYNWKAAEQLLFSHCSPWFREPLNLINFNWILGRSFFFPGKE